MLALDRNLLCIEADESEVMDVYQSETSVVVSLEDNNATICQAYVCAIRKNDRIQVHAALVSKNKKIYVYTPGEQPENEADLPAALDEGLRFVADMGFRMEKLNLDYSAAMKAVVLKNISVFHPPRTSLKTVTRKGGAEPPPLRRHEKTPPAMPPAGSKMGLGGKGPELAVVKKAVPPGSVAEPAGLIMGLQDELDLLAPVAESDFGDDVGTGSRESGLDEALAEISRLEALLEKNAELARETVRELADAKKAAERLEEEKVTVERQFREELTAVSHDLALLGNAKESAARRYEEELAKLRAELSRRGSEQGPAAVDATALLQEARAELEASRASQSAMEQERERDAQKLAGLSAERETLRAEVAALGRQLERTEEELADALARLEAAVAEQNANDLAGAAKLRETTAELLALKADMARLNAEKEIVARQQGETAAASGALKEEMAGLLSEKRATAQRLEELSAALHAQQQETELMVALKDEAVGKGEEVSRELASLQGTMTKISAERAEAVRLLKEAGRERQELAAQLAETRNRLTQAESLRPVLEQVDELKRTIVENETVLAGMARDIERLMAEKEAAALGYAEALKALHEEISSHEATRIEAEIREQELTIRHQTTQAELTAVRMALENVIKEKVASARLTAPSRPGMPGDADVGKEPSPSSSLNDIMRQRREEPSSAAESILQAVRTPQVPWNTGSPPSTVDDFGEPEALRIGFFDEDNETSDQLSPSGGSDDSQPVFFTVDKRLSAVMYKNPGEVVELHQSINTARVTPSGEQPQNSKAFICCVRSGDVTMVAMALFLLENSRTLVYVPDKQPHDDDSCRKIVRDAIGFAETVGFMMEPEALSNDPRRRAAALARIPVLKRVGA